MLWMLGSSLLPLLLQAPTMAGPQNAASNAQGATSVLAGGYFWGMEAVFEHVKGVKNVVSGYAGGTTATPSYEEVSTGRTGHAESVRITYDPRQVSYRQLLSVFFTVAHNPTELNRQGPDVGSQYRSAIFVLNDVQRQEATSVMASLERSHAYPGPLVTQVVPLRSFHQAEAYHQNYLDLHPDNPYIVINDLPKLGQLRKRFPALYRPSSV